MDSFHLACLSSAAMTGWLEQIFISHSSGGWEVQDQGASQLGSWLEPSSWLAVSSCRVRSRGGADLFSFSYKDTDSTLRTSSKPNHLQRSHFQIPAH